MRPRQQHKRWQFRGLKARTMQRWGRAKKPNAALQADEAVPAALVERREAERGIERPH